MGDQAAGPFIVLGILEVFAEGMGIQHRTMGDAADHAEEMFPTGGFAVGAEALVEAVGKNRLAIRAGDLAGKSSSEFRCVDGTC